MTREEAIKRLETCDECGDCLTCAEHDEALHMAISALREQVNVVEIDQFKTNADHIRSMTDEELAVFLECFTVCHYCSEYEEASFVESGIPDCDGGCKQHVSDWLKQPYKEGA